MRSNARRHLRTHGVTLPPGALGGKGLHEEAFTVGFETPVVVDVQDPIAIADAGGGHGFSGANGGSTGGRGRAGSSGAPKLRWVPPSLAQRTNAARLRSLSPSSDMADVDGDVSAPAVTSGPLSAGTEFYHQVPGQSVDVRGRASPMVVRNAQRLKVAPAPLPPTMPLPSMDESVIGMGMGMAAQDVHARFDERNSYAEAGTYPYHPSQVSRAPLGFRV